MRIALLSLLLVPFLHVYAEEPMVMEQVTANGMIKVELTWPEVLPDELYHIGLRFLDPETNQVLDDVTITYDVVVLQNGAIIELYPEESTNTGTDTFEVVFPEDGIGPAEVIIGIRSIADNSGSTTIDEEVSFNVQVVPEFGIILMVMAASIGVVLFLIRFKMASVKSI